MSSVPTADGEGSDRIGRYRVLHRIAYGGMAEIFLAKLSHDLASERFERLVVLKQILPELARNRDVVDMFLDEARVAAQLQHPNVVQVYDAGASEGRYYIAMEFVHGQDARALLREAARRGEPLPLGDAIAIGIGLCAGLHYAHERTTMDGAPLGLVHRDVSPSNVLISYDGAVKVADFGIAKVADRSRETSHGTIKGKCSYMSPEQCLFEPLDRRSDVFCIGIVLHELLSCQKLFHGKSDFEVMEHVVRGPIPSVSARRADIPPELDAIVTRALARDRNARFATAQELQLALEDIARTLRLNVSSVALAATMRRHFPEAIAAWQHAKRDGTPLEAHLAETLPSRSGGPSSNEVRGTRPVAQPPLGAPRRRGRSAAAAITAVVVASVGLGWVFAGASSRPDRPPPSPATSSVAAPIVTPHVETASAEIAPEVAPSPEPRARSAVKSRTTKRPSSVRTTPAPTAVSKPEPSSPKHWDVDAPLPP